MKFIENIVIDSVKERMKRIFLRDEFEWYYNQSTVRIIPENRSALIDDNTKESIQFTHKLYTDGRFESEYIEYIQKIMRALEEKEGIVCTTLLRAKCNLVPQDSSFGVDQYHPPHVDLKEANNYTYTLIYYVNDSDGDTFIFNENYGDEFENVTIAHRQTPKEGCALLFKSNTYHAGSSPVNNSSRVVINIVFESNEASSR
jgi:hypothetical protein